MYSVYAFAPHEIRGIRSLRVRRKKENRKFDWNGFVSERWISSVDLAFHLWLNFNLFFLLALSLPSVFLLLLTASKPNTCSTKQNRKNVIEMRKAQNKWRTRVFDCDGELYNEGEKLKLNDPRIYWVRIQTSFDSVRWKKSLCQINKSPRTTTPRIQKFTLCLSHLLARNIDIDTQTHSQQSHHLIHDLFTIFTVFFLHLSYECCLCDRVNAYLAYHQRSCAKYINLSSALFCVPTAECVCVVLLVCRAVYTLCV